MTPSPAAAATTRSLGGNGNDALIGGAGADSLDGGAGTDTADYSGAGAAVTVYLDGTTSSGSDAAGDVLSNIEHLIGSAFADLLVGTAVPILSMAATATTRCAVELAAMSSRRRRPDTLDYSTSVERRDDQPRERPPPRAAMRLATRSPRSKTSPAQPMTTR